MKALMLVFLILLVGCGGEIETQETAKTTTTIAEPELPEVASSEILDDALNILEIVDS